MNLPIGAGRFQRVTASERHWLSWMTLRISG